MSKAEETRKFIIQKSAPVFNMKGYSGTSLSDLIDATGLTKGSIYGNFENKDEVAIAVYNYNAASLGKKLDEAVFDKTSYKDKLAALTDYYKLNWKKIFERGGCPILNASVEADDTIPFLRKHIQHSIKNWADKFSSVIEEGKKTGEFKKSINSTEYAYTFITLLEGGIMLAKIMNDQQFLFSAIDRIQLISKTELFK